MWRIVANALEVDSGRDWVTNDKDSDDPNRPSEGADWFHVDRAQAERLIELLEPKKAKR